MKSKNLNREECAKIEVLAYIEPEMRNELDFRFLPSGTQFVSTIPKTTENTGTRRLIIASTNPQVITDCSKYWLKQKRAIIEVIWNPSKRSHLAHALINMSKKAPTAYFRVVNETAHLIISSDSDTCPQQRLPGLTPNVVNLLEEAAEESVPVPPAVFKQLLWRHSYLLGHIDNLTEKAQQLSLRLERAEEKNSATQVQKNKAEKAERFFAENEILRDQLSSITENLADTEKRLHEADVKYEALSNSKLGAFTLKYWAIRRK